MGSMDEFGMSAHDNGAPVKAPGTITADNAALDPLVDILLDAQKKGHVPAWANRGTLEWLARHALDGTQPTKEEARDYLINTKGITQDDVPQFLEMANTYSSLPGINQLATQQFREADLEGPGRFGYEGPKHEELGLGPAGHMSEQTAEWRAAQRGMDLTNRLMEGQKYGGGATRQIDEEFAAQQYDDAYDDQGKAIRHMYDGPMDWTPRYGSNVLAGLSNSATDPSTHLYSLNKFMDGFSPYTFGATEVGASQGGGDWAGARNPSKNKIDTALLTIPAAVTSWAKGITSPEFWEKNREGGYWDKKYELDEKVRGANPITTGDTREEREQSLLDGEELAASTDYAPLDEITQAQGLGKNYETVGAGMGFLGAMLDPTTALSMGVKAVPGAIRTVKQGVSIPRIAKAVPGATARSFGNEVKDEAVTGGIAQALLRGPSDDMSQPDARDAIKDRTKARGEINGFLQGLK